MAKSLNILTERDDSGITESTAAIMIQILFRKQSAYAANRIT